MTEADGPRGAATPAAPTRILVVDDEPGVLHAACRILARRYAVTGASSGPEAIEILAREPHDLAIAVSKTVNLANDTAPSVVKEIFLCARDLRLKGITVYRYGCRPGQALSLIGDGEQADCRECAV